jgi:uncharacterized protein
MCSVATIGAILSSRQPPGRRGAGSGYPEDVTSLSQDLLDILVCPKCKGDLAAEPTSLRCDVCHLRYRVDDGIPVMLIDEAEAVVTGPPTGEAERPSSS